MRLHPYAPFLLFCLALSAQPTATFETLARQADAARDEKQIQKALPLYREALRLKPDWVDGLWSFGSITYDLDQYAECAPAFHKLAALKPDSAPAWSMAGLCEYRLRRYDDAAASLERAERLKFEEPLELARAARLHFALVLTKTGSFEKAITVLTELTRLDRKTPEISVAAGIAGLRRPWLPFETPEADRDLVMKLGDAMSTAMELDYKQAISKFEAAAQAYPSEPNVHYRFGAFLMTQDETRGIEEIKKTLGLAPDHVPALVSLAAIYLKREDMPAAIQYGERAVKASPGDFSTHLVLGRAFLAADQPAKAAPELEAAVKIAPANPDARYSLASAYSRLGRKEDAAREYQEFKHLGK